MSNSSMDEDTRVGLGLVGLLVALVVAGTIGGALLSTCSPKSTLAAHSANPDDAHIVVENGVVKFYFAPGKAQVADDARDKIALVDEAINAGKKAVVSGYVDSTGSAQANAEISKARAQAVEQTLLAYGIPQDRIELRKPADTNAGTGAQARRVEVVFE